MPDINTPFTQHLPPLGLSTKARRRPAAVSGLHMAAIMGKTEIPGTVGLELEFEGQAIPHQAVPPYWKYVEDHSLRGQDNGEFILINPIEFEQVPDAIGVLWAKFSDIGTKFDVSNRTSVHVHLNFQKMYLDQVTSFCALFFTFEEILANWCGDHRVGNLFCLRGVDAPGLVTHIRRFIEADGDYGLHDSLHYAGLSIYALRKFGSIEIRTMRGATEPSAAIDWVSILERLYKTAASYTDPREVCYQFSALGPQMFFDTVLGPAAGVVTLGVSMTPHEIKAALYRGIRLAQDLCFCRDWSQYSRLVVKPDPFGRSQQEAIAGIQNAALPPLSPQPVAEQVWQPVWYSEGTTEVDEDVDVEFHYDEEEPI